jgi:hypothetical protein
LLRSWSFFSLWRTANCLWRPLHGWRIRRGILLSNMGGSLISGLIHSHIRSWRNILLIRVSTIMFFRFYVTWFTLTTVCIFVMQRPGVIKGLENVSSMPCLLALVGKTLRCTLVARHLNGRGCFYFLRAKNAHVIGMLVLGGPRLHSGP